MVLRHDYFIIESLNEEDINDGKIFHEALLSLGTYNPIYIKVYDKKEFENALLKFSKSDYKYLFISAHGDDENIYLEYDSFNAYDLDDMKINFNRKRIFMSTCRGGSFLLAKYFITKKAYSVIGSPDDLNQIVAVGMWPTMILIFERLNKNQLNFYELNKTIKQIVKIYEINLSYHSFIRNKNEMKEYLYNFKKSRTRNNYPL